MKKVLLLAAGAAILCASFALIERGKATPAHAYDPTVCAGHLMQGDPCITTYYAELVHQYDEKVAIADIKERYSDNAYVAAQCHPIMHIIGAEASKKYPNVAEAYLHGDPFCWSGYYHGVMEGVIAKIGEDALPSKLNNNLRWYSRQAEVFLRLLQLRARLGPWNYGAQRR